MEVVLSGAIRREVGRLCGMGHDHAGRGAVRLGTAVCGGVRRDGPRWSASSLDRIGYGGAGWGEVR